MKSLDGLLRREAGIRLDIACGKNKRAGWVGIDIRSLPGVDIVHDLEEYPWPLPDECVLAAICSHYVEHINPARFGFIHFMDEVWRIMKPDGQLMIATPHVWSPGFAQDPTHCNPVNENTFDYFDPEGPRAGNILYSIYEPKPWAVEYLGWHPIANVEVKLRKRASWNGASQNGDAPSPDAS